jgi:hypothetical protein
MSIFRRGAESFLPKRDYLPLAMPTTGISLLDLLTKDGPVLRRYSSLSAVLTPGVTRSRRRPLTSGWLTPPGARLGVPRSGSA